MKWPYVVCMLLAGMVFLWHGPSLAQKEYGPDRYTPEGRDRWKNPLELEDMKAWEKIPFSASRFEEIRKGMTESEVLDLLGKPKGLNKVHRPGDRWSVRYRYPGGRIVNFFNGLVVGKEIDKDHSNRRD